MKRGSSARYPIYVNGGATKRRRTGTKTNPIVIKAARPARRNARTGGFMGLETKFIDYSYSGAISTTITGAEADPATVDTLSAIAQGDGESNRDGRKCVLTSLHIRGDVQFDSINAAASGSTPAPDVCRVAVVWDTQSNGAQLNAEDVFLPATHVEHAFRNLQYTKRFKVLYDECFEMVPSAMGGNGTTASLVGDRKVFKINKALKVPVLHDGTTASMANITDNSLHVIAFGSSTGMTLTYESRVRFQG